jgi:hypothetical protein
MKHGRALRHRYGRSGRPAVRGQAQLAIMDYMDHRPGVVPLTDMMRGRHFHGLHFKKVMSAARALAKEGKITFDGVNVAWVFR